MRQLIALAIGTTFATLASAEDISSITIPISARLEAISALVEREMPVTLVSGSSGQTCVQPERACTKVPEFRGFKVTMKNRCVEVTPRIECTIDQKVVRTGPIRIAGSEDAFVVHQALQGEATVRGRGEVGRHIRESATGSANLTVTVAPVVEPDWSIGVARPPTLNVSWTQRPTAMLFGNFPVTFTQDADRAIQGEFNSFLANDLSAELQKVDLKSSVVPIWNALQQPVPVNLPGGDTVFVGFKPRDVALAPLRFSDGLVHTTLSLTGALESSVDGEVGNLLEVPNVSAVPEPAGLSLSLPLQLDMSLLADAANSGLPAAEEISILGASGKVEIQSVEFLDPVDGKLVAVLETTVSLVNEALARVALTISGKPAFDQRTTTLVLADPEMQVDGEGVVGSFLEAIANSRQARTRLAELAHVSLGPEISEVEKQLIAALSRELGQGVRSDADLSLTLGNLEVTDTLNARILATGRMEVTVLELN